MSVFQFACAFGYVLPFGSLLLWIGLATCKSQFTLREILVFVGYLSFLLALYISITPALIRQFR
jgi:hypothetical protein